MIEHIANASLRTAILAATRAQGSESLAALQRVVPADISPEDAGALAFFVGLALECGLSDVSALAKKKFLELVEIRFKELQEEGPEMINLLRRTLSASRDRTIAKEFSDLVRRLSSRQ